MPRASFDPTPTWTDSVLVGTVESTLDAQNLALGQERKQYAERDFFDSHNNREMRSLMAQDRFGK